jgi:hypothetical protein
MRLKPNWWFFALAVMLGLGAMFAIASHSWVLLPFCVTMPLPALAAATEMGSPHKARIPTASSVAVFLAIGVVASLPLAFCMVARAAPWFCSVVLLGGVFLHLTAFLRYLDDRARRQPIG